MFSHFDFNKLNLKKFIEKFKVRFLTFQGVFYQIKSHILFTKNSPYNKRLETAVLLRSSYTMTTPSKKAFQLGSVVSLLYFVDLVLKPSGSRRCD